MTHYNDAPPDMIRRGTVSADEADKIAEYRKVMSGGTPDFFFPPHGGRPPSDEAVRAATLRYIEKKPKARRKKGLASSSKTK